MSARFGYSRKDIKAAVIDLVKSGGYDKIHKLFEIRTPGKHLKRLRKALRASDYFQVKDKTVWNSYGFSFCGVSSWGHKITARMQRHDYRFQILHLDRLGIRTVYAVPIAMTDRLTGLPQMDLSQTELSVIRDMARELEGSCKAKEYFIEIKHPSKATIQCLTKSWPKAPEMEALAALIQSQPVLLQIAAAVLDCQLRALKRFRTAPSGIYNFLTSKDGNSFDWFMTAMRMLTFVNELGRMDYGPVTIHLKDAEDLKRWRKCHERLAVIVTSSGSLLWSLIEEIEEDERIIKSGGSLLEGPLPTLPISICRSVLDSPYAIDIKLPDSLEPLTEHQQDVLRSAVAMLLKRGTADKVYAVWKREAASPFFYRRLGFQTWYNILLGHIIKECHLEQAGQELYKSVIQQQEQERQERADALKRAVELLIHPEQYESEILPERPKSKKDAKKVLSDDAVAFWFKPDKGKNKDQVLLAFSGESLKRLLRRVDCGEELYDAFLRKCKQEGVLDKRSRTINLFGESFTAVTFLAEKF